MQVITAWQPSRMLQEVPFTLLVATGGNAFQSWHDLLCVTSAGAKHREEIYQAFEKIYPVLQEFRKGDNAAALPPPLPIPEPAVQQPPPSNLGAPLPQLI